MRQSSPLGFQLESHDQVLDQTGAAEPLHNEGDQVIALAIPGNQRGSPPFTRIVRGEGASGVGLG
jgi:hypothetical protein